MAQSPRSARRGFSPADLEAYLALAHDRPGLDDILPTMLMQCCLYAGEIDPIYPEVEASPPTHTPGDLLRCPNSTTARPTRGVNLCCLASPDSESGEYIVRRKQTGE